MAILTRRSMLRGTPGIAASGMLARPHLANAAATTATVWWAPWFRRRGGCIVQEDRRRLREVPREDDAMHLDLTDAETRSLLNLFGRVDRGRPYPNSPRVPIEAARSTKRFCAAG
jgi:hypothetical protein